MQPLYNDTETLLFGKLANELSEISEEVICFMCVSCLLVLLDRQKNTQKITGRNNFRELEETQKLF